MLHSRQLIGAGIMKHYRVNKVTKPGGVVLKKKDSLARSDSEAIKEAEDSAVFDKSDMAAEDGNELYDKAVKVILRDKKCSTSYIQRRLGIGYNKAASLVERMEKEGLVGAANHVGKREILNGSERQAAND